MFPRTWYLSVLVLAVLHLCLLRHSPQHKSCWSCRLQLYATQIFSLFFYISLFWNLESILIYSFCSFLCSFLLSILSILLFFSTLLSAPCSVFSLSIYSLYFLNSLIVFFSNLLSFIFLSLFLLLYSVCFSLIFYYYSICSLSLRALHPYLFCSCFCFLYTPFFW